MNRNESSLILRLVVGGYLVYLAYNLISGQLRGETGMSPLVGYGAGGVIGLFGLGFCIYAWKFYQKQRSAQQDEDSSSEEEE